MFSPSRNLLFTNLKIHHPLPLNSRESKQLLNLLTTSFRQHLDAEHPAFRSAPPAISRGDKTSHHKQDARRKSISESSRTPVDTHMLSMLTNPLFGYKSTQNIAQGASDASVRAMRIFDHLLAKGGMNIEHAKNLLKENKRAITASSVLDIKEDLKKSQAGSKVLKWLMSSGVTKDLNFLRDEGFAAILIEHLVAEDLQEVVWSWIKKSLKGVANLSEWESMSITYRRQLQREIVQPLLQLVIAEAHFSGPLDRAYMCLSRAIGYLGGLPADVIAPVFYPPGRFLVHATISSHSTRAAASSSDFESFLGLVAVIFRGNTRELYTAHLELLQPTNARTGPALQVLRKLDRVSSFSYARSRDTVQLGLDTAKYLLENDRIKEASEVMDILQVNFPEHLGVSQKRQLDEVRAEASTMELLEGLSLA